MAEQTKSLDLARLFQSVTGTLQQNRDSLNEADTNNHDHGDNMVDTFEVITQAMKEKKGADPADQLEYAAQILRQRQSGSAQLYASGLEQASRQFAGQQINGNNAMTLIQTLLGGGQAPQAQTQQDGGNIVGNLIGSLLGGSGNQQGQSSDGFGLDDLVNAGMAFFNTRARGGGNLEAIVNAVVSGSAMGGYRQQSGNLVATALMQAVKGMIR